MFSKFRTGAKKAANRQSRYGMQDEEVDRPTPQRGHTRLTGLHGSRSVDMLSGGASNTGVVPSVAPTLPPIPRVASKTSQHGEPNVNGPLRPPLRSVDTQRTLAEEASPLSDDSTSLQDQESLQPVQSIYQAKTFLYAEKNRLDGSLMPPPPRPSVRPGGSNGTQRSRTDLGPRPASAQTEKTMSSMGSSFNDIPLPYRIQEPEEWVTPPQAIQLGPQPPSRPKSRLTRLNPLSYLSRKKSSQPPIGEIDHDVIAKRASFTPAKPLAEDFDPRIKGKVIHDFTSPRPSHFVSVQNLRSAAAGDGIELPPSGMYDARRGSDSNLPQRPLGDPSPERRHTPVFKEDFDISAEGWRLNPDDRRNQTSSDIVDKVAAMEKAAKEERRKSTLPAFAVHMPEDIPSPGDAFQTPQSSKISPRPSQEPELALTPNSFNSIQQTPDSLKPPRDIPRQEALTPSPQNSPLADRLRATSPDTPQTLSSLPKRLRSKTASVRSQASRFSFDLAPTGSAAQEKLLEERHRQRAAKRARATSLTSISIHEEDDYNEDDIDFDADDMEEDIPGMNDDVYDFGSGRGVANMTLGNPENDLDEYMHNVDDQDDEFETGGIAVAGLGNMTLESFETQEHAQNESRAVARNGKPQGLGLELETAGLSPGTEPTTASDGPTNPGSASGVRTMSALENRVEASINELSNNDFYFDDGEFGDEFGDIDMAGSGDFDEGMLDQDYARGKLINSLKPLPVGHPGTTGSSLPSTRPESIDSETLAGKRRSDITADTSRTSGQFSHVRRSSAYGQHDAFDAEAGLTQENLSAYHNALAFAANKAAMQGRFDRKAGTEDSEAVDSPVETVRQRNVSFNEPRTSFIHDMEQDNNDDDFNFDDSLDDEAIIAAANAEALENDEEDFYGSEFGFYASAGGATEAQAYHGGYFGPAGQNGIKRSHSGRDAFQEPNLTPITERSEWSNRNSMINFAMQGSGISPGVASPGGLNLAQLADQMQHDGNPGEDMTLSALMKARRGAFGGSSTSLHSMGNPGPGSRSGSPSLYAFQQQQGVSPLGAQGIAPPPPLLEEREEPDTMNRPRAGSLQNPMLTLQTQNLTLRPTTSGSDSSPMKRGTPLSGRAHGHSRTSSGADSVSYAMQKNEEGDEMWVVEKRRTLDNGDVEILARDQVRGTL